MGEQEAPKTVRAKFMCQAVEPGYEGQQIVSFSAVVDEGTPEDARYHKYTPSGSLRLTVDNPNLVGFYQSGKKYYLDMTEAPA